jgi:hypothetical protein
MKGDFAIDYRFLIKEKYYMLERPDAFISTVILIE